MTKAEMFKEAHSLSKKRLNGYDSYAECFAEQLKAIYKQIAYDKRMDAKYGKDIRPSFQIIEPKRLWA